MELSDRPGKCHDRRAAVSPRIGPPILSPRARRPAIVDGPFTEARELVMGNWPARAGRFARVNGLDMYYEVHGRGRPLVLLHASLTTIDGSFGSVLSTLAADRQVIAIEQQAHGRTPDIDRPVSYGQMADDTAELLRQLDIQQADFLGFSMGGSLALQVAIRHPGLARKLAVVSGGFHRDGLDPDLFRAFRNMEQNSMAWRLRQEFERFSTEPDQWHAAVRRVSGAFTRDPGLTAEQLGAIRADTLVVGGSTGIVRAEHTHQLAALVPGARLRMLDMHDHDPGIVPASVALLPAFLECERESER